MSAEDTVNHNSPLPLGNDDLGPKMVLAATTSTRNVAHDLGRSNDGCKNQWTGDRDGMAWLASPGPVLLRRHMRAYKAERLVEHVFLLHAIHNYAYVRFGSGKEDTASTRDLTPTGAPTTAQHPLAQDLAGLTHTPNPEQLWGTQDLLGHQGLATTVGDEPTPLTIRCDTHALTPAPLATSPRCTTSATRPLTPAPPHPHQPVTRSQSCDGCKNTDSPQTITICKYYVYVLQLFTATHPPTGQF
ncbi:uncharacterized protein [Narcine bancroftii]|uniref:uncharacterized protein n=1 Tax=Narcine bancroftii TaxID=1343680 RepID=UPI003831C5B4